MRYKPPLKIDLEQAQKMLDDGETVIAVALTFQVSSAAVYRQIKLGNLVKGRRDDDGRGEAATGAGAGAADARQEAEGG